MFCNPVMKRLFCLARVQAFQGVKEDGDQSAPAGRLGREFLLQQENAKSGWWRVVETMADLVAEGCQEADLTAMGVRQALLARGFPEEDIAQACAWIERSTASGSLAETWAMLQPHRVRTRVGSPLEQAYFSADLWDRLELARQRALIPADLFEKLLEGVRVLDPREWDDSEVESVMGEMVQAVIPQVSAQSFRALLQRKHPMLLC